MKLLGLTGDIACGKSTVAQMLVQLGAVHLDADVLVRELYAPGAFAMQLAALFGDILDVSGGVSREKLGALVFEDAEKLLELEAIVHPAVAALRTQKLEELANRGAQTVVMEAVKLLESGQGRICHQIWCVVAAPEVQRARLIKNRGLSPLQAEARLAAQPSRTDKMKLASPISLLFLENNGTLAELEACVAALWMRFQSS